MTEDARQDNLDFDTEGLCERLQSLDQTALDALGFGVIGFDDTGRIGRYNAYESKAAHFPIDQVMGQHVFEELAPCLNNYLVATRFEDAHREGVALDDGLPYVLTFRMRPTPVKLRLLSRPDLTWRFVLVLRPGVRA